MALFTGDLYSSNRAREHTNPTTQADGDRHSRVFLHSATTTGLIGPLAAYLSSDVENIDVDDALLLVMIMVMTIGEPDSLAYIINTSHTL